MEISHEKHIYLVRHIFLKEGKSPAPFRKHLIDTMDQKNPKKPRGKASGEFNYSLITVFPVPAFPSTCHLLSPPGRLLLREVAGLHLSPLPKNTNK